MLPFKPQSVAAACGLSIELIDLGSWGSTLVVSEYDAVRGVIRINTRALAEYRRTYFPAGYCDDGGFIDLAVAHELYHHYEATGKFGRLATPALREIAANRFARANVPVDAALAAFLQAVKV